MKAEPRLGLDLSWSRITSTLIFDVAVLVLARHVPGVSPTIAWWVGVGIAATVTIALLLAYRRITLASALAKWVWEWSGDSAAALRAGCTPAIDHRRRFGRDVVGVREYQGQLVAVIALTEAEPPPAGPQRQKVPPATLSVAVVAEALRQFDVHLDAIDIVSVQKRRAGEVAEASGPRTHADHAADIEGGTWLVLRMDPQHNVAGVAARDSVASTLAAAVERLAGDLDGRRCVARPLTAEEFGEVDAAVIAGLETASIRPGWRHLKHFDGYATSFWVSPHDITSEALDRLWLHETDATVLTMRLTAAGNWAAASVWVRFHSRERLGKEVWAGLNRLTGRQLAALRASLPAPSTRPPLAVPARWLDERELLAVRVDPAHVGAGGTAKVDAPS